MMGGSLCIEEEFILCVIIRKYRMAHSRQCREGDHMYVYIYSLD